MINYDNLLHCAAAYCLANKGVWLHITNAQLSRCIHPRKVKSWAAENKLECVARTMDTNDGYKFRSI